ncbi:MAG: glycoside hydrolase family 55 protein, partial [Hymenobacteraceae bacterium]|nr:glycoside hydrolase family 55 protein [Hymenobacteraceae bacterium]
MIRIVLSVIALTISFNLKAQVLSVQNTWNKIGYQDSVAAPATVLNVLNFGALANGIANDAPAIQAAIAALNGRAGVVFLPAGTYKIQQTISLLDSVVLRGAGADSTMLNFDLNGAAVNSINISSSQANNFIKLQQPARPGEKQLMLSSAPSFAAGDWVELRQQNGSWDTKPASWANFSVGQIVQLDSVAGQQLFLSDPLRIAYDTALQAELRKIVPARQVGIECLKLKRTDTPINGAGYGIYFNFAVNSWVKGIESDSSVGSHIQAEASAYLTIRDSYFH